MSDERTTTETEEKVETTTTETTEPAPPEPQPAPDPKEPPEANVDVRINTAAHLIDTDGYWHAPHERP